MSISLESMFDDREVSLFLDIVTRRLNGAAMGSRELAGIIAANVYADITDHFEKEEGPDAPWIMWTLSYSQNLCPELMTFCAIWRGNLK